MMVPSADTPFPEYQAASDNTPQTFVDALKRGDATAWSKIVRIWGTTLRAYSMHHGFREQDAEEITQNVLARIYRGIDRFKRDGKQLKLKHWVFDIARKEAIRFRERYLSKPDSPGGSDFQRAQAALSAPDIRDEPAERESFETMLVAGVLQAIEADFDPRVWQAFHRFTIDGLSGPEVGQELGMQANAVRQAVSRVKTRIRAELDGSAAE